MKKLYQNKLDVKKSKTHGYGVFAGKAMRKGEKLEECYAIFTRAGDKVLEDYYFEIGKRQFAILFGYGCIYNHADEPNADFVINRKTRVATIEAAKPIKKGEEILLSYGEEYFTSRGWTPRKTREGAAKKQKPTKSRKSTKTRKVKK